ncbi:hypothetical protein FDZ73_23240 [bacterium]|nr:MAG: hypothetical protein FDZ73_23240 [bacterium]
MKRSFIIGLLLTGFGCFLPWQIEGDFLSFWLYGIRIFPSFEDNGGLVILFLVVALAVLIFKPPSFIKKPEIWIIVLSSILTLDSIFHIGSWLVNLSRKIGIVGAPLIHVGLVMVIIGSITLFITSLMYSRRLMQ